MDLAILHHHLNRGGVTSVILNHIKSLATLPPEQQPGRVAVLYDGQAGGWPDALWAGTQWAAAPPFKVQRISTAELAYDGASPTSRADLIRAIEAALVAANFSPQQTLLHVHNHSLGKKAYLPDAVSKLVEAGWRVLLQIHDFAEDFRPANYQHFKQSLQIESPSALAARLYPAASGIAYATLNGRDLRVLQTAGAESLHLLANPVAEFPALPPQSDARQRVCPALGIAEDCPLVLYPVRGIRRKNVGELLLHSALAGGSVGYALTLAPANPAERASFDQWSQLATELGLNCHLGIGDRLGVDFLDAMSAADAIISTSVAEGFGMVFLEAWLAGRPLVGRNLPEITSDFVQAGLQFDRLYDQLWIPTEWIDLKELAKQVEALHTAACEAYGVNPQAAEAFAWDDKQAVDFAILPRSFQTSVIRRAAEKPDEAYAVISQFNPGWLGRGKRDDFGHSPHLDSNAELVRQHFSPTQVGRRLHRVYQSLMQPSPASTVGSLPNGQAVLDSFLQRDRIHPIRLEA